MHYIYLRTHLIHEEYVEGHNLRNFGVAHLREIEFALGLAVEIERVVEGARADVTPLDTDIRSCYSCGRHRLRLQLLAQAPEEQRL